MNMFVHIIYVIGIVFVVNLNVVFCSEDDCAEGEFKCADSSKCIDDNLMCNGRPDCSDHSDEDKDMCGNLTKYFLLFILFFCLVKIIIILALCTTIHCVYL